MRYSAFDTRITLPSYLNDCNNINPDLVNTFPTPAAINAPVRRLMPRTTSCFLYGQASLPVRVELASGPYVTSMLGYGFTYNTLDNNKSPTAGVLFNFGEDFAGLGGSVSYLRSTVDVRSYYEVVTDLVSVLHLQGGDMIGFDNCPQNQCASNGGYVRMLDDFKMGPNLVRGFQPAGIGPRDITYGTSNDNLGGTMYWGASLEFQYPFYFLPKDAGFRGAVFVDSGSVWGYKGETQSVATGEINGTVNCSPRPSSANAGWSTPTMPPCARRSAPALSGIHRSVRCASTSPIHS